MPNKKPFVKRIFNNKAQKKFWKGVAVKTLRTVPKFVPGLGAIAQPFTDSLVKGIKTGNFHDFKRLGNHPTKILKRIGNAALEQGLQGVNYMADKVGLGGVTDTFGKSFIKDIQHGNFKDTQRLVNHPKKLLNQILYNSMPDQFGVRDIGKGLMDSVAHGNIKYTTKAINKLPGDVYESALTM